ncbi:Low-density lipoprotein receptor domain class A [Ancylostoma caninum]|uniref:Low-density lipoprotein receptor domain class A n=1 Tax=Ancylostoma caninum TaxID=29170 RepID=A0A368GFI5_ANCCA|nr:Low-density lipoprotein receptor domain class A [Ancylostoma caninum]
MCSFRLPAFTGILFLLRKNLKKTEAVLLEVLKDDVLEVRGRNGGFLPLCFNSAREEYAEEICSSLGRYLASFESVSLSSQASYSIACVGGSNCFPYPTTYCKHGIAVKCTTDFCPPGSMPSGRQCLQTAIYVSASFSDARMACSLRVLSLPRESDRVALLRLMSESFGLRYVCIVDLCWKMSPHEMFAVHGEGRCLAISGGVFHAVECDSPGTALCEVARECVYHDEYNGKKNNTRSGLPCMKWNDPSVLFYGVSVTGQNTWDHNFCRILADERTPSCFSSPSVRDACLVAECPDSTTRLELKADLSSSKCGPTFFACRDTGKCLPDDFRCDYEPDCNDASDEEGCEDYLQQFELVGTLKIADRITEIWTYIPHVQGCARRCNESALLCEAFSYEPQTQTCLLTDSSEVSSNLAVKLTSQYYRKRFSTKDVHFQLVDAVLRVAKNRTWAHVCDDGFSSVYATSICKIFGYGYANLHHIFIKKFL